MGKNDAKPVANPSTPGAKETPMDNGLLNDVKYKLLRDAIPPSY
jgi:hypothetical protein